MRTHEVNLPICSAEEIPLFVDSEGKELGKVNVLEVLWRPSEIKQKAELIVCLDVSEAMHGEPINRAKEVLVGFRNDIISGGRATIAQTVTFAEGIKYHDMLHDDFEEGLKKVEADGKLNYLTLFKSLKDYIRTAEQTNVCIVILSCGPNTCGTMRDMELALNGLYEACSGKLVEFHTVGLGAENDVNLLRILSNIGSCGSYQYAATERDLARIFMGLESVIRGSGYAAELVSAEGVVTKLVRCRDNVLAGGGVKFRLYGADSSILSGAAKYDIVLKTSRGKLLFPVSPTGDKTLVGKFAACNSLLQRIELLYLQASSYAQQLSRKLPKNVVLEHTQQFAKFAHTAKDIYTAINRADVFAKRICMFSMIRLFDYLATYYNCLCKLSKSGEEELTFADLSILHSCLVFALHDDFTSPAEKITTKCELDIVSLGGEIKTNCLGFLSNGDTIMLDSEAFLDSVLFAKDLARHQDLFGLYNIVPVDTTKCTVIPLYIFEEHWAVARERRKMINVVTGINETTLEFSLLSKLMHKLVEMFSGIGNSPVGNNAKISECEKHYKLLLETCAALLRGNESEVKLVEDIFNNYTNPGSEVRLPKHTPNNEVFLMKLFVAFYAKIIPIEKSEKFVERLNLLCLFMFEEEMRRLLGNIPYVNGDYLWKIINVDFEIYACKLQEIKGQKSAEFFKSKFGITKPDEIVGALRLFAAEFEGVSAGVTAGTSAGVSALAPTKSETPENESEMSFDSMLSFNFSNDLQKHIDRFNIPEQIRDLLSIQNPSYQFILDFMSMCTGSTISTENNFGICSLAILLQNILHLDDGRRSKAILNSDFAAVKNPEEIGFGKPYMFKPIRRDASCSEGTTVAAPTLSTYIDMVSIGCYDRAQLYVVFLLTQKCLEFLDKMKNAKITPDYSSGANLSKFAKFATCTDLCQAVEILDGCKFGSEFSKYLDALLNNGTENLNALPSDTPQMCALPLDKLCLLVFGGFFKITAPNVLEFVQLIDDMPSDRKVSIGNLTTPAWKPNKQNIYKVWGKLGHLAPKSWWLQLFSHNKHAVECRYLAKLRDQKG